AFLGQKGWLRRQEPETTAPGRTVVRPGAAIGSAALRPASPQLGLPVGLRLVLRRRIAPRLRPRRRAARLVARRLARLRARRVDPALLGTRLGRLRPRLPRRRLLRPPLLRPPYVAGAIGARLWNQTLALAGTALVPRPIGTIPPVGLRRTVGVVRMIRVVRVVRAVAPPGATPVVAVMAAAVGGAIGG